MIEITTTRANPGIDPGLHVWGWEIPVYLFLGGLVAGTMLLSGYLLFSGRGRNRRSAVPLLPGLSLLLLTVGMGALFLDLEHKPYFWRLYATFEPASPMSWGAWILLLVYPVLAVQILLTLPPRLRRVVPALGAGADRLARRPSTVRAIGVASMALGVLLGVYTGVLLSALGARPLWNSALLGPLFLLSGLSAAAALIHLISRDAAERDFLTRSDSAFLVGELALLALFLVGLLSSTEVHVRAAGLLLGGPFGAVFWVGVVGLGILTPLAVQLLELRGRVVHTPIAPLLVIAGGVVLRFVIVQAGQASHWTRVF